MTRIVPALAVLGVLGALLAPAVARAALLMSDNTPFAASRVITGAAWAGRDHAPPPNQRGDILPTVWGDDGNEYTMMDDGGTDLPSGADVWKQSLARITGSPPQLRFRLVGDPTRPAPATVVQIHRNRALWTGPLGPYYSSGLVEADKVLFATEENDWNWAANGPFAGLQGIAYSTDHGQTWQPGGKPFPAPLGNLSWVIRGQGGNYVDGHVYAIATEREFNATNLIMGRSRTSIAAMTDPAQWQWASGWRPVARQRWPVYSSSLAAAAPIVSWPGHITYPQMSYDAPLRQYLLTFTYSYWPAPPAIWRSGSELVILSAPHPWGPFSFVAREPYFGPSNGYGAGFPVSWISRNGRDAWLKWSANFDGCSPGLDCAGAYGFNYRQVQFTLGRR